MGIGPVPATEKALGRAGLALDDMGVIEHNEAFAAQTLAVLRTWNIEPDDSRLNLNGSGISLGHPVGATGGRILATLLREMRRRETRYGLETMCIGGGQGLAAVFENAGAHTGARGSNDGDTQEHSSRRTKFRPLSATTWGSARGLPSPRIRSTSSPRPPVTINGHMSISTEPRRKARSGGPSQTGTSVCRYCPFLRGRFKRSRQD